MAGYLDYSALTVPLSISQRPFTELLAPDQHAMVNMSSEIKVIEYYSAEQDQHAFLKSLKIAFSGPSPYSLE